MPPSGGESVNVNTDCWRVLVQASAVHDVYKNLGKVGLGIKLYAPWLPHSATSLRRKSIRSCKLGAIV